MVNDGKMYGDYCQTSLPLDKETKMNFVKASVSTLLNQIKMEKLEPDFGTMQIIVKEFNPTESPFGKKEENLQKMIMTVGIRFEVKKDQEEENHD